MAAPQWTTLGLQEIRRIFRQRWLTPGSVQRTFALAISKIQTRPGQPFSLSPHRVSLLQANAWKCTKAKATVTETLRIQELRGSIVGKISDNVFTKLRVTRAYIKLLCLPEGEAKVVSLMQIRHYEIRMLEASKADTADGPLFLMELYDHDAQLAVASCVCNDIEEGVAAFEDFISR